MADATDIQILPSDDNTNGWSRVLPPRTPKAALQGDVRADWVVLGAGWAGMAAARRLAENRPEDSIILVDAGQAGENASGRNSGFAIDLPDNVTLYENTPVTRLEQSNGITLTTPQGSIYAPRMILTTNAFAGQFGFFENHLIPIAAHASLTRPLTPDERAAMGGQDDWGLTPANAIAGVTMRFTQDHRILIRQGFQYKPGFRVSDGERAAARVQHTACFRERFPMLPDVTFDHTWTGIVCLSRNSAPGFGKVAPNIWTSVCQNAVGVTKGTIGGLLAADMACERDNDLIGYMESLGEPDVLPHKALLKLGVPARIAWDVWSNRHEK